VDIILSFLNQWLGTDLPKVLFLFIGILLVLTFFTILWGRKETTVRGTTLGAPLIILISVCAVFIVGLSAPQVMVGDEVTHFYMMETQSQNLSKANFTANIPNNWGDDEVRHYPHSFLWHYFGAVLYRLSGSSFSIIQLYQALFLAQFLVVACHLARSRRGVQTRSALPYLLVLASVPMTLMFSVTFYQDIPMAAQIVTGFYLLRKNQWLLASFFMCLAIGLKVTAILFFPAFFVCMLVWSLQKEHFLYAVGKISCAGMIVLICTWGLGQTITANTGSGFYPVDKAQQLVKKVREKLDAGAVQSIRNEINKVAGSSAPSSQKVVSEQKASIIANHPGDLRIKQNYFIYGGILLWVMVIAGILSMLMQIVRFPCKHPVRQSTWWLWGVGLSYTCLVAFFLKTSPDARFFLPGLPFLLLPIAEKTVCLPRPKWVICLIASLAILQGGYVLAKTYNLRRVSPEIEEGIHYLEQNPPSPNRIFMYPEGNYRLFPASHEWYLGYYLRDFWRSNNALRIQMLKKHGIGAVVIKKHLIHPVDKEITNLGVYPPWFVTDLANDSSFIKVFENEELIIFDVPD